MNDEVVCIYHANCFDGMAAAWVVSKKFPNAKFIPAHYGDKKLEINLMQDCYENANINTHYIIVDFSLPRDLMVQMYNKAKSMIVLDHHKSAQANCKGLEFCKFDMNESGASLAWKHYFPNEFPSLLVDYIADRDLWKFELPDSENINAYIQSYEMNLENYQMLHELFNSNKGMDWIQLGGQAINRYKQSMVKAMCKNAVATRMDEYLIPTINSTLLFSEVGHYMCNQTYDWLGGNKPVFAASYFIRQDGKKQWSLRSIGDFDVSEVAKRHGGGGHKNAAGFEEEI